MRYAIIPDSKVSLEKKLAAHRALGAARAELRLPMVNIEWFIDARYGGDSREVFDNDSGLYGLFKAKEPDKIYISVEQSTESVIDTAFHEAFHCWQWHSNHGFIPESEELAQGYSADALARMRAGMIDEQTYHDHICGKDFSKPKEAARVVPFQSKKPEYQAAVKPIPGKGRNGNPFCVDVKKMSDYEYDCHMAWLAELCTKEARTMKLAGVCRY